MVTMRWALVLGWGLILACSEANGNGPASQSVSAAQACADNAHERCLRLESCSTTDVELRYGGESACEMRETTNCTTALGEPFSGNTPDAVEACASAYAAWACADYLSNENVPPPCQQQLGPIVSGGSCATSGQCATGFCAIAPGASCGTCGAPPTAGASCAELISCGPSLTCAPDTVTCVRFGVRGAPCGRGAVCGVGLWCVGADPATDRPGTCDNAVEKAGAPCDPTARTGPGCDRNAGLVCNSVVKQCQKVVVASAGDPCGDDVDGQPVYCAAEGTCERPSGTAMVCVAAAADGAACDVVSGPGCIVPARCIGDGGTAGRCQYSGTETCHG